MGRDRTFEPIALRKMVWSDVTTSYQALGDALDEPVYILFLFNGTDGTIFISENGTDDHYRLLANGSREIDVQANAVSPRVSAKKTGTQFYARAEVGDLPSSGYVWFEGQVL